MNEDYCFNYIWVLNNFIAYWSAPYIRDVTAFILHHSHCRVREGTPLLEAWPCPSTASYFTGAAPDKIDPPPPDKENRHQVLSVPNRPMRLVAVLTEIDDKCKFLAESKNSCKNDDELHTHFLDRKSSSKRFMLFLTFYFLFGSRCLYWFLLDYYSNWQNSMASKTLCYICI